MVNLGKNFYPKLVQISSELGMKPEDLLAVMVSESGINPAAHEKKYNGGGLLGFMPYTLKSLNFKGSPEEFRKLSGEEQLDWVKKLVESKMPINGGKPFQSAVQYYIANFVPAALKLPGIRKEDPNYAFLEENPEVIKDPKTGQLLSKKYYEVGVRLPIQSERLFYKANPLFHGSTPGAITYGDMARQISKNKQTSTYKQAINNMRNSTGYVPTDHDTKNTNTLFSGFNSFISKIDRLLNQFSFASQEKNNFLISVGSSSDRLATIEYARILSTAIEEYLGAKTAICVDENNVEIECQINGDKKILFDALKELSIGVSYAFKDATKKIGSVSAFALVTVDNKSDYEILDPKQADLYSRKFKLKFMRLS